MDIWEWVEDTTEQLREAGHERLAFAVEQIPQATCNGDHEETEQLCTEALALARQLGHVWLEVFIRHWRLQSRVLWRRDASRGNLEEAVSLLDFASQETARGCPQSVCVTQDLVSCYGVIDGPGYADERLRASQEGLERIDSNWPCFDCLSGEYAEALLDDRKYTEMEEFGVRQASQKKGAHLFDLSLNRAFAELALGRPAQAMKMAEGLDSATSGDAGDKSLRVLRALCLARLGKTQKAIKTLPKLEDLQAVHWDNWFRCLRELAEPSLGLNSWRIEASVHEILGALRARKNLYRTVQVRRWAAQLAVARGAHRTAAYHLRCGRDALGALRRPEHLKAQLDSLSESLAKLGDDEVLLPSSVDEVEGELGENPEVNLVTLAAASRRWRLPTALVHGQAAALRALGRGEEIPPLLRTAWSENRGDPELLLELGFELLNQSRFDELGALASDAEEVLPLEADWLRAHGLLRRDDLVGARGLLEKNLGPPGETRGVRSLLIHVLRRAGDLEAALEHLNAVTEYEDPGDADWDRMVVATQLERWEVVRAAAARLELPVDAKGEGPIDERWGYCRVRRRAENGLLHTVTAERTGPVTAKVCEIAPSNEPQFFADEVVFEPTPLSARAVEDAREAGEELPLQEFDVITLVAPGHYRSFAIDGVHPGDKTMQLWRSDLADEGVFFELFSDPDTYRLGGAEGHDKADLLPGLYGFVASPADVTDEQLAEILARVSEAHGMTCIWPALLREIGAESALAQQMEICERYGIEL